MSVFRCWSVIIALVLVGASGPALAQTTPLPLASAAARSVTPEQFYARSVAEMRALRIPLFVTFASAWSSTGMRFEITQDDDKIDLALGTGRNFADRHAYAVAYRHRDRVLAVTEGSAERIVGRDSHFLDPTWAGAYDLLRYGTHGGPPPIPAPNAASPARSAASSAPSAAPRAPGGAPPVPSAASSARTAALPATSAASPALSGASPVPSAASPAPSVASPVPSTSSPAPSAASPAPSAAAPAMRAASPAPNAAPPVPVPSAIASASATGAPLRTIGMVSAISAAFYRVEDQGAGSCPSGAVGHLLKLSALSDPRAHPLTAVTIDVTNNRFCSMRFNLNDSGVVGVTGTYELHFAESDDYWLVSGGAFDVAVRVLGISARHVSLRWENSEFATPADIAAMEFEKPTPTPKK